MTQAMLTRDEIKKINFVQNVSGADLTIPGLSENGKGGITIAKDEIIELDAYVSQEAKARCRALQKALAGIPTGTGEAARPWLIPVDKPTKDGKTEIDKKKTVITHLPGEKFKNVEEPQRADENIFDVKLMEEKVKEMEANVETIEDDTQREMVKDTIEKYKQKIEIARKKVIEKNKITTTPAPDDKEVKDKVKDDLGADIDDLDEEDEEEEKSGN